MTNGFILSQRGVPVQTAADYQKVIDSRWKFFEVAVDTVVDTTYTNLLAQNVGGSVTGGTLGYNIFTLANHNLGYLPYFEYEVLPNTTKGLRSGIYAPNGSDWLVTNAQSALFADDKNVYFELVYYRQASTAPATYTGTVRLNIRFKVYAVDIQQEYTAPSPAPIGGISYTADSLGVKILQNGVGQLEGEDPRDFSTNTAYKTLSLQKTGTGIISTASPSLIVNHGAGYPPSFLITRISDPVKGNLSNFSKPDYPFVAKPFITAGNDNLMRSLADNANITFAGFQALNAGYYGYIILKDPAEIAQ